MNVARVLRALPRTQNLVLLASDMKGFTARMSSQTREESRRMLGLHDALLLPVLRGYGGRKVKAIGDALVAAFESPTDAVLCAMAIQDRLAGWNLTAKDHDRIEVRIALSQGEVRQEGKDLVGEPVQLALDAQAVADAGDVVLTDAVYLSMNKCEAPTEILGHRVLRGGGTIRLRRALRGKEPKAPYGGRALARLGKLPHPSLHPRLDATRRALEPVRKRAVWIAAAFVLLAAAAGERKHLPPRDPVLRAAAFLDARQPTAALAELDKVAETAQAKDPNVALLRGKAEHALGQLGIAFSDFAAAGAALDDAAIGMLADDLDADSFPEQWRPALVKLLGEGVGRRSAPAVRKYLSATKARARDAAIEVLELASAATDEDRLVVARSALADPHLNCSDRRKAVRRLAMVRDERVSEVLKPESESPKACASREARDILRKLPRS